MPPFVSDALIQSRLLCIFSFCCALALFYLCTRLHSLVILVGIFLFSPLVLIMLVVPLFCGLFMPSNTFELPFPSGSLDRTLSLPTVAFWVQRLLAEGCTEITVPIVKQSCLGWIVTLSKMVYKSWKFDKFRYVPCNLGTDFSEGSSLFPLPLYIFNHRPGLERDCHLVVQQMLCMQKHSIFNPRGRLPSENQRVPVSQCRQYGARSP